MADWVTISSLATAGGTLVLAVATFAFVKSANRSARVAELSVMASLRPLLMPSGGQRTITRFSMMPKPDGGYIVSAGRVWDVDRGAPR